MKRSFSGDHFTLIIFSLLSILILIPFTHSYSQKGSEIVHRVYLTGNTADISRQLAFNTTITDLVSSNTESFSVLLNGDMISGKISTANQTEINDNLYKLLLPLSQFEKGKIVIIPGERDWADSKKGGLKNVKHLENIVKGFGFENVIWVLKNGCPGPEFIKLAPEIYLTAINTQWWNHPHDKPQPSDADCKISTTNDFKEELEDIINAEDNTNLIIAGHFPVYSLGEYGGHFSAKTHIFPLTEINQYFYLPLPIIGSFYPSYRKTIGTSRDISNENFAGFRELMQNIISSHQSLIYASGHEKNLQIIRKENNYYLNSGSPDKPGYTVNNRDALYSKSVAGILELIYYNDGKIVSRVHEIKGDHGEYSMVEKILFQSTCDTMDVELPFNYQYIQCRDEAVSGQSDKQTFADSVSVIAGEEYAAGAVHRFFFGDHYRDTWTAPVTVPHLKLEKIYGGLTPLKRGGGRQTESLKFMSGQDKRYVFRSVNKDPIKALDYDLRETIVADIVRDQTTTQHPYGAMAADIILNELDILHAHPKLYVLPDMDRLGIYRHDYAGMLGMLEDNPKNPEKGGAGYQGASEILRSHKMFRSLYKSHKNRVDSKNFAVARCFDILVGDWGKHEDNWKWAGYSGADTTIFKPMPRDRDHVFSIWDGLLPWLADREWAKPSGENFDYQISGLRSLMWQARHLDRFLGAELAKADWILAANFVQDKITDEIIERSIRNMPKEIYTLSGLEIEKKLKQRVLDLDKYALEYYEMLAKEVDVVGSNKREYFEVIRNNDGSVQVNVSDLAEDNDYKKGDYLFYQRLFFPDETDEIRLFGLDGVDVFDISGKCEKSILIRVIGGPGADKIYDTSEGSETIVYEKSKNAEVQEGEETVRIFPSDETLYNYNRTAFAYDTYFPLAFISYNADLQFLLGLNLEFTLQKYGVPDYHIRHAIKGEASTAGTFNIGYDARIHHFLGKWDLTASGFYANPNDFLYFYGLGNETVRNDSLFDTGYYKTRFRSVKFQSGLFHDFWKRCHFIGILRYDNNQPQIDTQNTILADSVYPGTDKVNMAELALGLDLDFRDDPGLPNDGMRFFLTHNNGLILSNNNSHYGKTLAYIEFYASFLPLTMAFRTGGGGSWGEIPFYNQFTLGQNTFLRGYRNNRFTGESMAFVDSELRIQLIDIRTILVPVQLGLKGFFDTGRIFQAGEDSKKWHMGYGFGIFAVPLKSQFTFILSAGFSEEESWLINFGIGSIFK